MQFSGRRGVVDVDVTNIPRKATKKTTDHTRFALIHKEANLLKKLNEHGIRFVPQLIDQGAGRFSYVWIPGERFDKVYAGANDTQKQRLNRELLDKAFQLDTLGVIHGELDNPMSNILVNENLLQDNKSCIGIIDFERGHRNDTSGKNLKHVMQWLQRQGFVSIEECKQWGKMDYKTLYTHLQQKISMSSPQKKSTMPHIVIALLLGIDQLTKQLFYNLQRGADFMLITPVLNTGIGRSIPFSLYVLIPLSILIIGAMMRWIRKQKEVALRTGLFIAGAIGNLIDRVRYQGVRDFIDFHWWPVFNVADIYLTCSILILFYLVFTQKNNEHH